MVFRVAHELGKFPHEVMESMTNYELAVFVTYLNKSEEGAPKDGNA